LEFPYGSPSVAISRIILPSSLLYAFERFPESKSLDIVQESILNVFQDGKLVSKSFDY